MSAVVEMWMSELGKIGEAGKRKLVLMSKAKVIKSEGDNDNQHHNHDVDDDGIVESKQRKERVFIDQKIKDSSSTTGLSEETIFMIMDRFAPL